MGILENLYIRSLAGATDSRLIDQYGFYSAMLNQAPTPKDVEKCERRLAALQQEMQRRGLDIPSTPGVAAVKHELREVGKAIGNPRLGNAMARALGEMSGACPSCGGPIWVEAEECGHCHHRLKP